jgi:hypothetical protein
MTFRQSKFATDRDAREDSELHTTKDNLTEPSGPLEILN